MVKTIVWIARILGVLFLIGGLATFGDLVNNVSQWHTPTILLTTLNAFAWLISGMGLAFGKRWGVYAIGVLAALRVVTELYNFSLGISLSPFYTFVIIFNIFLFLGLFLIRNKFSS